MRAFRTLPNVALAVYAHPDDADVAAGGVLATWAQAGCSTHLVIVCDGAKGSHDASVDTDKLRERRAHELQVAAGLLGVGSVRSLGRPDGGFSNDEELREQLVGIIRTLRPSIVLGPDPTATFFGGVYINHRDHRELGWALLDAVAPASAMPQYYPEQGPSHEVSQLLLSGTHEADVVADISNGIEQKVKAVLAHESQLREEPDWVRSAVSVRAEQAGREIGVTYGEAFRLVDFTK